jgi:hypothetical protein
MADATMNADGDAMAGKSDKPLSVYRLLPSLSDYQAVRLDPAALLRLKRWQRAGADGDRPAGFVGEWMGERRWPKGEFPSGYQGAPVLSRRAVDRFGEDDLLAAGSLLPVDTGDRADEYVLYLVEQVVDCLDRRRSSKPKRMNGEVKKAVFRREALPTHLPAFRLPEFRSAVQWNGWASDRLVELLGDEMEARLVWSEDPAAKPHPDPWGI